MRKAFAATIQIVIQADSAGEAADAISEMIRPTEERLTGGSTVDWTYKDDPKAQPDPVDGTRHFREIEVSNAANYEEGEVFNCGALKND